MTRWRTTVGGLVLLAGVVSSAQENRGVSAGQWDKYRLILQRNQPIHNLRKLLNILLLPRLPLILMNLIQRIILPLLPMPKTLLIPRKNRQPRLRRLIQILPQRQQ